MKVAHAEPQPATHVWVETGNSSSFVPAADLDMCFDLIRQVAKLEQSAEGHCYFQNIYLGGLDCSIIRRGANVTEDPVCEAVE